MKTRSLASSRLNSLSISKYGAAGVCESFAVTTRLGPNAPMCSQTEADPGPPLKRKVIGRGSSFVLLPLPSVFSDPK
jgi:hypothetical protein